MFVFSNLLAGLASVLDFALQLYTWILIGRAIVSWVDASPYNPIVRFLTLATNPPLRIVRAMLPVKLRYFPLDIAFLALFGILIFARVALVRTLFDVAVRMR